MVKRRKRYNVNMRETYWKPTRKVWFQNNSDGRVGQAIARQMSQPKVQPKQMLTNIQPPTHPTQIMPRGGRLPAHIQPVPGRAPIQPKPEPQPPKSGMQPGSPQPPSHLPAIHKPLVKPHAIPITIQRQQQQQAQHSHVTYQRRLQARQ
jgi:hypothetical protein